MTTFTIDAENRIQAFPNTALAEVAAGSGVQTFGNQKQLANLAADWPAGRLVETWNGFAGVVPFDHLKPVNRLTGVKAVTLFRYDRCSVRSDPTSDLTKRR